MVMRSLSDIRDLFLQSNTGTIETGAPYGRCLLKYMIPGLKEVVILRPVEDCVESVMRLDLSGVATFDRDKLRKVLYRGRRAIDRITRDPSVLVVNYEDLDKEETCATIFEFCLPYKFDKGWWEYMRGMNIQVDFRSLVLYRFQNKSGIDSFKSLCKRELIRLVRMGAIPLNKEA